MARLSSRQAQPPKCSLISASLTGIARRSRIATFNTGTIANDVYWDKDTTGQTAGGGSLPDSNGLTTAQMSTPSSFVSYDFSPTGFWAMPAGATHPILRWQLAN